MINNSRYNGPKESSTYRYNGPKHNQVAYDIQETSPSELKTSELEADIELTELDPNIQASLDGKFQHSWTPRGKTRPTLNKLQTRDKKDHKTISVDKYLEPRRLNDRLRAGFDLLNDSG